MKKWLVYVLGIITGIVLTCVFAICVYRFDNSEVSGLELFDEPGEEMDYSQFEVFQVIEYGYALAEADETFQNMVLIIPSEKQQFYDNQNIVLKNDQYAQRVGTFRYVNKMGMEKTVPAVIIVEGRELPRANNSLATNNNSGITLFDKPGDCVSRKNFEVQKVLDSGDAIAKEIREAVSGYVFTSDLEVLILSREGSNFYDKQIVKTPQGKCARQIGNYKYQEFGTTKVIPIVSFK